MPMANTSTIWVFPKIILVPPNHPFVHRVFHEINHPFWGPLFLETPIYLMTDPCGTSPVYLPIHKLSVDFCLVSTSSNIQKSSHESGYRIFEHKKTHSANESWDKSLNFIFPTKHVIPESLKFSHWLPEKNLYQLFPLQVFLTSKKTSSDFSWHHSAETTGKTGKGKPHRRGVLQSREGLRVGWVGFPLKSPWPPYSEHIGEDSSILGSNEMFGDCLVLLLLLLLLFPTQYYPVMAVIAGSKSLPTKGQLDIS